MPAAPVILDLVDHAQIEGSVGRWNVKTSPVELPSKLFRKNSVLQGCRGFKEKNGFLVSK